MLFILKVSGFHVLTDQCKSKRTQWLVGERNFHIAEMIKGGMAEQCFD